MQKKSKLTTNCYITAVASCRRWKRRLGYPPMVGGMKHQASFSMGLEPCSGPAWLNRRSERRLQPTVACSSLLLWL
jgi:hypothetical protein